MDCIFCKIAAGQLPCHKIYEDKRVLAFLDIHPVNPGHALIVPKAHSENVIQTPQEDVAAIVSAAQIVAPAVQKAVNAPACNLCFNCGAESGQVVFHTHLHVIPRFEGDGHRPWAGKASADGLEELAKTMRYGMEND